MFSHADGFVDEEDDESTPPSSPPPVVRRGKFDDEEEDSDVVDSWDAEDSEVEREKVKKAAEAKAKEEAEKKANHKSAAARRKEHIERRKLEAEETDETSDDDEDETARKARLLREQKQADLGNAADLFGDIGVSNNRSAAKKVTLTDPNDPGNTIDLSALALFNPKTKDGFTKLRETLVPLLTANSKAAQYSLFLQEFSKLIAKDLPSDQIKKIASGLTTLSNEKMKEEKAAEKGGKKSKAAKSKMTLNANRDISSRADLSVYDDGGLDDGDFM